MQKSPQNPFLGSEFMIYTKQKYFFCSVFLIPHLNNKQPHKSFSPIITAYLDPILLNKMYRRLRLNYKPIESWIYSFLRLIWGIFICVQMRT